MEIAFLPVDLGRWDGAKGDVLAVCLWSDVRPLRGAAGLLDWRLCGKLSGWIESGRLGGAESEQTLFPAGKRVAWRLVLALGLGPHAEFTDKKFRVIFRRALDAVRGLNQRKLAMALPGRESDKIAPKRAIEIVLEELKGTALDELVLIEPAPAQKEMAEVLRKRVVRLPSGA